MSRTVIFIPSYNRPAQLHLLLRSIFTFFPVHNSFSYDIRIYYQATNDIANAGYEKLIQNTSWSSVRFYPKFKTHLEDVRHALYDNKYSYFWFITDDSIIRDDIPLSNNLLHQTFQYKDIICLSTRSGLNIPNVIWNDSSREVHTIENYKSLSYNTIGWPWRNQSNSHFRHPIAIDGTLIPCSYLKELIEKSGWCSDYRAFECNLNDAMRVSHGYKEYCASFINSKLVNIPANQVVQGHDYSGKFHKYTTDELNQKYLDGFVINLYKILEQKIVSVQQEFPLEFIGEEYVL